MGQHFVDLILYKNFHFGICRTPSIQLHADPIDFLLSRTAIQFLQMCPLNPIYASNMSKEVILFMFLYQTFTPFMLH